MILRKPYAVFIKYFKLLHVVMASFIAILLYRSYVIYNVFRMYSIDYRSVMGDLLVNNYLGFHHFLFVFIVLVLTVVLLVVMIYKDKPKDIYIYNLILYIFVLILFFFCSNVFMDARNTFLDIKLSKGIRDFSLIACFLQFISLIITVIRATGFDIKRFDFGTDLQQLNISSKDSEEIEVSLEFDPYSFRKNLNNRLRNAKYVYAEHKFIINTVVLSIIMIVSIFTYLRIHAFSEKHNAFQTFSVGGVTANVQNSYLLDSDNKGKKITSVDGTIVAVRIQLKGYGSKPVFNSGTLTLIIDGLSYGVNADYSKLISNLGTPYTSQVLDSEFTTYLFAFEVSNSQAKKSMILKFNDMNSYVNGKAGAKNFYVKIKPTDLRGKKQNYSKKLGEKISFDSSVLGNSDLTITDYKIANNFKLDYKFCYRADNCIDSHEYVVPTFTGNYYKALMRISGNVNIDGGINNKTVYDLRTLLNEYGYLKYKVNNEWKNCNIDSEIVKPISSKSKDYFIEVPSDSINADEIYLMINIYNQIYKYVLK